MPIKTRFVTKGFEEYYEALARAGEDIDAAADEALAAGGEVILEGMRRRVPKLTGNLLRHLECSQPQQDGNLHFVDIGLLRGTDAETARYGNVQEFGSSDMSAQPYVRPSFDEDMRAARLAMRKVFEAKGKL